MSEDNKVAEILNTYFSESIKLFYFKLTNHLSDPIEIALPKFNTHPSILKICGKVGDGPGTFKFKNVTVEEVIRKINSLNRKKATTSNSIPITNMKEHVDISGSILCKIINLEISNFLFPDELKLAELSLLHKENDVMNKRNYRPISILPSISEVFERLVQDQITDFIKDYLYMYMCGYQKGYNNPACTEHFN